MSLASVKPLAAISSTARRMRSASVWRASQVSTRLRPGLAGPEHVGDQAPLRRGDLVDRPVDGEPLEIVRRRMLARRADDTVEPEQPPRGKWVAVTSATGCPCARRRARCPAPRRAHRDRRGVVRHAGRHAALVRGPGAAVRAPRAIRAAAPRERRRGLRDAGAESRRSIASSPWPKSTLRMNQTDAREQQVLDAGIEVELQLAVDPAVEGVDGGVELDQAEGCRAPPHRPRRSWRRRAPVSSISRVTTVGPAAIDHRVGQLRWR